MVMSTTLLIGRWPAAVSRALSQSGEGPIVTSGESPGGEPRAEIGHLDGDRRERCDLALPRRLGVLVPRRRRQRGAADRVDLAGHPVDTQAVGPVRGDLEVENGLGDRKHLGEGGAGRGVGVEDGDPVGLGADLHLLLGEDHPRRRDAAQLRLAELRAVAEHGSGKGDRDGLPGGDVGSPADDRPLLPLAYVDPAHPQPVGVRVRVGGKDAADDESVAGAGADGGDPLDLGAGHRQPLGEQLRRQAGVAMLVEPGDGDLHRNCSSIRTSLSKNIRRSGTPCLSMAIRSMPIPKAKPWTRSGS